MAQFVITGQPPDRPGRLAVGPFATRETADRGWRQLHEAGWQQVWLLPADAETTAKLVAGKEADGDD